MIRFKRQRDLLVPSLVLLLAGCGFQPIYMPTASGKAGVAQRELAAVYVSLMPNRPGQLFRQAMQANLGDDSGAPQHYDLDVTFWIAGEGIAVNPDSIATRIRFTGNVIWTLHAHDAARTTLTSGSGRMVDGLNLLDEQYFASDLETETIQKRLADVLAQQVATRLAIYFRHRAATPG
jgi:LPS-assembly lipoprotein